MTRQVVSVMTQVEDVPKWKVTYGYSKKKDRHGFTQWMPVQDFLVEGPPSAGSSSARVQLVAMPCQRFQLHVERDPVGRDTFDVLPRHVVDAFGHLLHEAAKDGWPALLLVAEQPCVATFDHNHSGDPVSRPAGGPGGAVLDQHHVGESTDARPASVMHRCAEEFT